ncbi:peptidyl-prolyl cis-trans isomerase D [Maritalea mobilis]|uniref:Peptidyl-prolyl cis-trans isomerase D n=1 Tax=Maritalea mobilis TaxID=483324 RepID=A0A4R6VQT7_9HYPH|nr:SurA N-terminal domain-containing protein [Maritalea mobilis]TDQ66342.1 peptidyl-prolyl cis-trans isomerase D [Maritalea mobilis]
MLDTFKRYSNTWVAKILMALLILSFGLFGIANVFTNLGSSSVARVGNQSISAVEFDRAYRQQLNNITRQTGRQPSPEEAMAFGIPGSVLNQLASNAALDQMVADYGIGASDEMVSEMIAQDPNFATTLGVFDRAQFTQMLRQNGFTESEYIDAQAESVQRSQVIRGLFGGAMAPATILQISNRVQNDTRTIDYFTISTNVLDTIEAPTEEQLTTYLEQNQAQYRAEAKKKIDVLVLTPESLARSLEASEEELRAEYEAAGDQLTTAETRNVTLWRLNDDAQAATLVQGIAQGQSLDQILAVNNFGISATPLGQITRDQIEDEAIAIAAFDGDKGLTIADAATGKVAVMVRNIVPETQLSFEEAQEQLLARVNAKKARDQILDKIDEIEEQRATLRPISEIAAEVGLETQTIEITQSGVGLNEVNDLPAEGQERLLTAINNAEQDALLPAVTIGANAMAWFDLLEETTARDLTLEEVREELETAWLETQRAQALAEKADALVAQINDGTAIFDVASEVGQIAQPSLPLTRRGDGSFITANVASAAFSGGEGHADAVRLSDGTYLVFQVTGITAAEPSDIEQDNLIALSDSVADDLYQQFITARRDDLGVSINQGTLNQILSLDQ